MSRVIVTEGASKGLERCRKFLVGKNLLATQRAAQVIKRHFKLLETTPDIGRPLDDAPELRELIIEFGDSGYLALYRKDESIDTVFILAFRHQKESKYKNISP
jgi:plasmid stabilization system protein ParE